MRKWRRPALIDVCVEITFNQLNDCNGETQQTTAKKLGGVKKKKPVSTFSTIAQGRLEAFLLMRLSACCQTKKSFNWVSE